MQNNFKSNDEVEDEDEEDEIENLESEFLTPFACGFCTQKFATVTKLEDHVNKSHKDASGDAKKPTATSKVDTADVKKSKIDFSEDILDEITDDFVTEIENENVDKNVAIKTTVKSASVAKSSTELSRRLVDSSKVVIIKPTEKNWQECAARNWAAEFGYGNAKNVETSKRSMNLISMMKTNFFCDDHEKETEVNILKPFLTQNFINRDADRTQYS